MSSVNFVDSFHIIHLFTVQSIPFLYNMHYYILMHMQGSMHTVQSHSTAVCTHSLVSWTHAYTQSISQDQIDYFSLLWFASSITCTSCSHGHNSHTITHDQWAWPPQCLPQRLVFRPTQANDESLFCFLIQTAMQPSVAFKTLIL